MVTGQRGVAGVEFALPTPKDELGHRLGVVPPNFPGKAATMPARIASVRSLGRARTKG